MTRRYRDTRVDVVNPKTITDFTAVAMLGELVGANGPVMVSSMDAALTATPGASRGYKAVAVKGLRNIGYMIHTHKAGRHSWYRFDGLTNADHSAFCNSVLATLYSQEVTIVRALAGALTQNPADVGLAAIHNAALMTATTMGAAMTPPIYQAEVTAQCLPL